MHSMSDTERNSLFCFPKSPDVSRDEVEGNIRTRGKAKLTGFPRDLTLSVLLYFQTFTSTQFNSNKRIIIIIIVIIIIIIIIIIIMTLLTCQAKIQQRGFPNANRDTQRSKIQSKNTKRIYIESKLESTKNQNQNYL